MKSYPAGKVSLGPSSEFSACLCQQQHLPWRLLCIICIPLWLTWTLSQRQDKIKSKHCSHSKGVKCCQEESISLWDGRDGGGQGEGSLCCNKGECLKQNNVCRWKPSSKSHQLREKGRSKAVEPVGGSQGGCRCGRQDAIVRGKKYVYT